MKKFLPVSLLLLLAFALVGGNLASAEMDSKDEKPMVELSDAQKKELDAIYLELLETKKKIINKYVEYGVLTQEKADKRLKWFEEHYSKVKEHGYLPMHHEKWEKDAKGKDKN
ncbi:YckD family protein [Fredinandcohnia sp. 179-A 10B2 NHS]|uniref:YckD family protein n=1 Tax=Fredinandcohnia sp. 179-A 10B2 NHS TaxID=3235176 RepID=UPI0039A1B689